MKKVVLGLAVMGALGLSFNPLPTEAGKKAVKGQPHMKAALRALENAEAALIRSKHNKGGHRVKALRLVREAISEVKQGGRHAKRQK